MAKKDYSMAIFTANLVSFIGWLVVILGIVIFVSIILEGGGSDGSGSFLVAYATIKISILSYSVIATLFGLVLVIAGQVSRAIMDNANYSAAILDELRRNKSEQPDKSQ